MDQAHTLLSTRIMLSLGLSLSIAAPALGCLAMVKAFDELSDTGPSTRVCSASWTTPRAGFREPVTRWRGCCGNGSTRKRWDLGRDFEAEEGCGVEVRKLAAFVLAEAAHR